MLSLSLISHYCLLSGFPIIYLKQLSVFRFAQLLSEAPSSNRRKPQSKPIIAHSYVFTFFDVDRAGNDIYFKPQSTLIEMKEQSGQGHSNDQCE